MGEQTERIIHGLLSSAAKLAAKARMPLTRMRELLDMAYFSEHRRRGRSIAEVADIIGVSERKGAQLSSLLKTNFMPADQELGLARRIEFMLWAEPLGVARIRQLLRNEEEAEIDAAIERLVREERVGWQKRGRTEVLARTRNDSRLVSRTFESQLDGLENLMHNVANATFAGFLREEPKATIRTIGFYMRAEDIGELRKLYAQIWETIQNLEERAKQDPNALAMDLSLVYAPTNYTEEGDPLP